MCCGRDFAAKLGEFDYSPLRRVVVVNSEMTMPAIQPQVGGVLQQHWEAWKVHTLSPPPTLDLGTEGVSILQLGALGS